MIIPKLQPMLFRLIALPIILLCSSVLLAQNFSFSPGNDYYGQLDMDLYTEHYLYVYHDSPDSAYITWRKIENTCPVEWDLQMCDWQHCYSGMPNTGHMNGVGAGNAGNLRLIVNPFNTPGSGTVHFWIFPTGLMDEYVDVYFHFETSVTAVIEKNTAPSVSFYNNSIVVNQTNQGNARHPRGCRIHANCSSARRVAGWLGLCQHPCPRQRRNVRC